ncbi:MAG: HNH endonuclease [Candidatus Binatia bacterium]
MRNKPEIKKHLWFKQNGLCAYCGEIMLHKGGISSPNYPTIDHIIPLSKGGKNSMKNTVLACRECNQAKADSLPIAAEPIKKNKLSLGEILSPIIAGRAESGSAGECFINPGSEG